MLTCKADAHHVDARGGLALTKRASIPLETDTAGGLGALNQGELLLKSIERAIPLHKFALSSIDGVLSTERPDTPSRQTGIFYKFWVATNEADRRNALLHAIAHKSVKISNTVKVATSIAGTVRRLEDA